MSKFTCHPLRVRISCPSPSPQLVLNPGSTSFAARSAGYSSLFLASHYYNLFSLFCMASCVLEHCSVPQRRILWRIWHFVIWVHIFGVCHCNYEAYNCLFQQSQSLTSFLFVIIIITKIIIIIITIIITIVISIIITIIILVIKIIITTTIIIIIIITIIMTEIIIIIIIIIIINVWLLFYNNIL